MTEKQTTLDLNGPILSFISQPVGLTTSSSTATFVGIATATFPTQTPANPATNTGTIEYRWYAGGSALTDGPFLGATISGTATTTLTLSNLQSLRTNNVNFFLRADYTPSAYGLPGVAITEATARFTGNAVNDPLDSNTVTLRLPPTITITSHPASTTVVLGSRATFAVNATISDSSYGGLSYQWNVDGQNLTDNGTTIIGATQSTLFFTPTSAGSYTVRVTVSNPNAVSVNSNVATLTAVSPRNIIIVEGFDSQNNSYDKKEINLDVVDRPTDSQAVCISVIDESSSSAEVIRTDWLSFRQNYPNRNFWLLQPGGTKSDLKIPTEYETDSKAFYSLVNRDNGNTSNRSDWFTICNLASYPVGTVVSLSIDNFGSMTTDTVLASYILFKNKCGQAGFIFVETSMIPIERWSPPHNKLLYGIQSNNSAVTGVTTNDIVGIAVNQQQGSVNFYVNGKYICTIRNSRAAGKRLYVALSDWFSKIPVSCEMLTSPSTYSSSYFFPSFISDQDQTSSISQFFYTTTIIDAYSGAGTVGSASGFTNGDGTGGKNGFRYDAPDPSTNYFVELRATSNWNSTYNFVGVCDDDHWSTLNWTSSFGARMMWYVRDDSSYGEQTTSLITRDIVISSFIDNKSLTDTTFGSNFNTITFYASEKNIDATLEIKAAAGTNTSSYTGGQGGYSRIRITLEKDIEYAVLGIHNNSGIFIYRRSTLIAAVGKGGDAGTTGNGGAGGGVGNVGQNGSGRNSGTGGVLIGTGNLTTNGIFGSNSSTTTFQSGDSKAIVPGGGRTISCPKGSYWTIQRRFSPCSNIGLTQFYNANGVLITQSSLINRGFKPGYSITDTGGAKISTGGNGGNGATGGSGGNEGGGGGGSGYTDGSYTIISSSSGGNSASKSTINFGIYVN